MLRRWGKHQKRNLKKYFLGEHKDLVVLWIKQQSYWNQLHIEKAVNFIFTLRNVNFLASNLSLPFLSSKDINDTSFSTKAGSVMESYSGTSSYKNVQSLTTTSWKTVAILCKCFKCV